MGLPAALPVACLIGAGFLVGSCCSLMVDWKELDLIVEVSEDETSFKSILSDSDLKLDSPENNEL